MCLVHLLCTKLVDLCIDMSHMIFPEDFRLDLSSTVCLLVGTCGEHKIGIQIGVGLHLCNMLCKYYFKGQVFLQVPAKLHCFSCLVM